MVQAQNLEHEDCYCYMAHTLLSCWYPILSFVEV